ncbi:hypothetical protein NDU88_005563 [Pleurodeles waltl]|uniref:Uncharacterized protein n=1 Tax=Pleurodeles waltl TaxID=8319 RepID=A0AAV7TAV0_PLEWA|nr:hypothetical protein NDU88_005563 [Pleurodeles waltl]
MDRPRLSRSRHTLGHQCSRSGTYPHPHSGDVGLRKALLAVVRERRGEREAADGRRDTAVPKRTAAVSVEVEAAAAPGPPAAEPAPDVGPTATPGGAAEEGGQTVWVWSRAADTRT